MLSLYIPRLLMSWVRRTDDGYDASSFILQQPGMLSSHKEEHLIAQLVQMIVHHMSACAEKAVAGRFWIGNRLRQGDSLVSLYEILAVLPAAKRVIRVRTIQLESGHNSGLLMMECRSLDGGLASRSASN